MIRVAIIDDHVVVRAGLRYIIEADPELEFVGEFGGGLGAVDFVMMNEPDVVLMDVRMPDRSGIDALKDILAANPKARVVMLTTSDAEEDVFRAIEEGALGYVMKESEISVISAAIRSAMAGEVFMTDEVRKIYETRKGSKGLSTREAQVLKVAATGANNKEIAKEMCLSENSVKMFLKRAFFKLGASNRAEAVQLAVKRGLIEAGFTLVELLIVVVVIVTLMSIVFRLGSIAGGTSARSKTVARLQRLENCISGYYAAFGSYPPVKLHGVRSIYYKVNEFGIQQTANERPDPSMFDWGSIDAACRSQPVVSHYPFPEGYKDYVDSVSQKLTELHNAEPDSDYGQNEKLADLFDALKNPTSLKSKAGYDSWSDCQLFRFGLLSYLLPRYLLMMQNDDRRLYEDFAQWNNNNQRPAKFEDGSPYQDWNEILQDIVPEKDGKPNKNKWKIEALPSQAVTARWMPNLEHILRSDLGQCEEMKFYGIDVVDPEGKLDISVDNPVPTLYSTADSQSSGSGGQNYALCCVDCLDGWEKSFYYYSAPPFQSYRLWSAGPNGKTFPPWISEEEIAGDKTLSKHRKEIEAAIADDIVHMSN